MIRFHHKPVVKGSVADLVAIVVCADRMADLVFENPEAGASEFARQIETLPPACTPAMAADVVQSLRRHLENLEI
jgi:hypothetical protein